MAGDLLTAAASRIAQLRCPKARWPLRLISCKWRLKRLYAADQNQAPKPNAKPQHPAPRAAFLPTRHRQVYTLGVGLLIVGLVIVSLVIVSLVIVRPSPRLAGTGRTFISILAFP